jgi:tight adherence protein B
VRGLSAEGRLSAYILIGIPVCLALYMMAVRPQYLAPLYSTALGLVMATAGVLLMSVGSFWMSRMVKVEV